MKNKSEDFYKLKSRILGVAFNLKEGTIFIFNDLNLQAGFPCSTAVQQEVGRWFAYFVKHAPNVPFEILGKKGSNLIYRKIDPNSNRYWKGDNS